MRITRKIPIIKISRDDLLKLSVEFKIKPKCIYDALAFRTVNSDLSEMIWQTALKKYNGVETELVKVYNLTTKD